MAKRVIIKELVTKMAFQVDARSLSNAKKRMRDVAKQMKDLGKLTAKPIVIKVDHKQVKAAAKELLNLKKRMQETIKLASRSVNFKVSVSGMAQLNALAAAAQRARASGGAIRYRASGGGGGRSGNGGSDTVGATLGRINPNRGGGGGGGAYASANAYARGGSVLDVAGGNMLSGAVSGGANLAQRAGEFAMNSLGEYQLSLTRLTTLVGKDKAKDVLKSLQKFDANTHFDLTEVMNMFTRLEGAGFGLLDKKGNVRYDRLTALGDLATSSNKPLAELTDTMLSANRGLASMIDNFVGLAGKAEDGKVSVEMFDRATGKTVKKTIAAGDKAAWMDFFVAGGNRQGISGGMEAMSKTIPGQTAKFWGNLSMASVEFMKNFQSDLAKMLNNAIEFLNKNTNLIARFGVKAKASLREVHDILKFLEPVAKGVGIAVGVMVANFVGGKVAAFTAAIYAMDGAMIKARMSAIALNLALTGGILLAMDFIQFFVTGDSQLLKFTERWPWLHDAIKRVYEFGKVFFIALGMGFEKIGIKINDFIQQTRLAGEYIQVWFVDGFKSVHDQVMNAWNLTKEFFGWIMEKAQPVTNVLRNLIPGFMRGESEYTTPAGALMPSPVAGQAGAADQTMANNLIKAAYATRTASGECLKAVWMAQNIGFKNMRLGASQITAYSAADAASQLAKDARFVRVNVTPEMLNNPAYARLLHGAQVIYNRRSGFSTTHGHGEAWDMVNKKALYGRGASPLVRNAQMLQNAQVFVPRQNMQYMQGAGGPQKPTVQLTVNQDLRGNQSPRANGNAAKQGASMIETQMEKMARFTAPLGISP